MTVLFDDALRSIVDAVETSGAAITGRDMTVIRGLDGRLRLAVQSQNALSQDDRTRLRAAIGRIGPYAAADAPIELRENDTLLRDLLRGHRKALPVEALLGRVPAAVWHVIERRFSKDEWLEGYTQTSEPWPYAEDAPKVVSFYSFKGGVGRTTALIAFGLYLAEIGRSAVVLDLDLESPGAGPLLVPEARDLGIVDFLIEDHVQQGAVPLDRFYANVGQPLAAGPGSLRVFPAGRLDASYLEKLGRIDMQAVASPESGARSLLKRLLQRVRDELGPDVVLLDVRAGLHDLGGISLSGLSHLELLFGLHTPPSWEGLRVVLGHLGRIGPPPPWMRIVHAMVPPASRGGDDLHRDFVQQAYNACSDLYYQGDDIPGFDDLDAPHQAYRLPYREALLSISDIARSRGELIADEHRVFCEGLATLLGVSVE